MYCDFGHEDPFHERFANVLGSVKLRKRKRESGLAVYEGGVENRYGYIVLVQQHADFRAAENQAVSSARHQAFCNGDVHRFTFCEHNVAAKLLINDSVRFDTVSTFRDDRHESSCDQPVRKKASSIVNAVAIRPGEHKPFPWMLAAVASAM